MADLMFEARTLLKSALDIIYDINEFCTQWPKLIDPAMGPNAQPIRFKFADGSVRSAEALSHIQALKKAIRPDDYIYVAKDGVTVTIRYDSTYDVIKFQTTSSGHEELAGFHPSSVDSITVSSSGTVTISDSTIMNLACSSSTSLANVIWNNGSIQSSNISLDTYGGFVRFNGTTVAFTSITGGDFEFKAVDMVQETSSLPPASGNTIYTPTSTAATSISRGSMGPLSVTQDVDNLADLPIEDFTFHYLKRSPYSGNAKVLRDVILWPGWSFTFKYGSGYNAPSNYAPNVASTASIRDGVFYKAKANSKQGAYTTVSFGSGTIYTVEGSIKNGTLFYVRTGSLSLKAANVWKVAYGAAASLTPLNYITIPAWSTLELRWHASALSSYRTTSGYTAYERHVFLMPMRII